GRAVLLDLSLACRVGERSSAGTFDYLSPEQARGDRVSATVDTWGLGATLYEALCGTTPWAHISHRARTAEGDQYYPQLWETVEALRGQGTLPSGLADVVDACLRPEPADRPDVLEVSRLLTDWCGVDPVTFDA